jgi:polyisoprenoid-binding protein YceI
VAVLAVLGVLSPSSRAGEEFQVDAVHSVVAFKVRHLVSRVAGNFRDFEGTILIDRDNLAKSSVEFVIASASIALDREDYGLTWNMPMDAGSLVLGKRVQIEIEIEAVKVKASETAGTEAAG